MIPVYVIVIGNEILLGEVQDTNSHWLSKQITEMGGRVKRSVTVLDLKDDIRKELKDCLTKRCVIFTSGGLGPTQDDQTLSAIAYTLDRELIMDKEAYRMISERYKKLAGAGKVDSSDMNQSREKMAYMPQGGVPLYNSVGTAPGVYLELGNVRIFCLPGVPDELTSIFNNSIRPILRDIFSGDFYLRKEIIVESNDESEIAPLLKEISGNFPGVYLKSRPRGFDEGNRLRLIVTMTGVEDMVKERVREVLELIKEQMEVSEIK